MDTVRNYIVIGSTAPDNTELNITPLPWLRATASPPADYSFFEVKGIPGPRALSTTMAGWNQTCFHILISTRFLGVIKLYASSVSQIRSTQTWNLAHPIVWQI